MPGTNRTAAPLARNRAVAELLSILRETKSPSLEDFQTLLHTVSGMEQQLEAAVRELAVMRKELAEAERRRHPIAKLLRKAVIAMQGQVLELREKLNALKQGVIESCQKAVAAFREKGVAALDTVTRFFHVRPALEAVQTQAAHAAEAADRTMEQIAAASRTYHEAGRRLKNAGRALGGKEAIPEAKGPGKVSKAAAAPFRAVRACFRSVEKGAASVADRLGRLEQQRPSIQETIRQYTQEIAQTQAAPAKVRPRPHAER